MSEETYYLVFDRLVQEMTYQQLAKKYGLKHPVNARAVYLASLDKIIQEYNGAKRSISRYLIKHKRIGMV